MSDLEGRLLQIWSEIDRKRRASKREDGVALPDAPYNQDLEKGCTKFDAGKNRLELLPYEALYDVGRVLTLGAKKYSDNNWRQDDASWKRFFGSTQRHLFAWYNGEDYDPDTGLLHLAHAACNILFLLTFQLLGIGVDDRLKEGQ